VKYKLRMDVKKKPEPQPRPPRYPEGIRPVPINSRNVEFVLREYLDKNEPKIQRAVRKMWNAEREMITVQEMEKIMQYSWVPIEWVQQWTNDYTTFVNEVMAPAWRDAMENSVEYMNGEIQKYARKQFEDTHIGQFIEEWIREHGGELIVELSEAQHEAIRELLRIYILEHPLSPYDLAKVIEPLIGLTSSEAVAVARYRESLVKENLSENVIENLTNKYAEFLLKKRALRIARTELSYAYNRGQLEAIREAKANGFFRGEVIKTWLTAHDERTCEFCQSLDGEVVGLEETYPGATKREQEILTPPAHPMCRCTVIYEVIE